MIVSVTQYMRPDGRKVPRELDIDDKCQNKYEEIIEVGASLACEQLMNGQVVLYITCNDGDFNQVITKGTDFEENKQALKKMILAFNKEKFLIWHQIIKNENN